jgi:hypothetical protein
MVNGIAAAPTKIIAAKHNHPIYLPAISTDLILQR